MALTRTDLLILKRITNKYEDLETIAQKTNENIDSVRRAVEVLKEEGHIDTKVDEDTKIKLGEFGKKYLKEEFPEEKLAKNLDKPTPISDLQKKLGKEAGIILGIGKKKGLVKIDKGKVILVKKINKKQFDELREKLQKIKNNSIPRNISELKKMPKMIEQQKKKIIFVKVNSKGKKVMNTKINTSANQLTQEILQNKTWKNMEFKRYNVEADVEPIYGAKSQPYKRFLDLIRKKLISMGFSEMPTDLITTEFYNFDALFQPQNHPARTWTDTYSLKTPSKGELPNKKIVDAVKKAHEDGGNTGSKGWGYKWSPEIAMKMMPAAQGTAFSAEKIAEGPKIPSRHFALARVYRPDVLDATHLNEFNQLEGFVVAKDISFKHLLGLLAKFAKEVAGAEEIRFFPDYYPFTEPSVQLSAKHPKLGWVEFGGAGIFRPEFTETLGVKERVIAWGLGIDRLAMFNLGINDIRDLFTNKLEWLREKQIVEKI